MRTPLKFLSPAWYTVVMGLAGLSLAWRAAVPVLGAAAGTGALVIEGVAVLAFAALLVASLWRLQCHPEAWAADLQHPVRHVFVAAAPIALLLLVTSAVGAGMSGPYMDALWWLAALTELSVTVWVMSRWWHPEPGQRPSWATLTPALFIPIVGNALVPLAGVPLGHTEWAAAQFAIGALFWPVVLVLLIVRLFQQGLWPEPMRPASFIFVAPPAAVGLSAWHFGVTPLVLWGLWGIALFSLLWVLPLLSRIASQPFGMAHWGMSFPLAAFTALTLRLASTGQLSLLGVGLLAATSLLITALAWATWRGLRNGSLLAPEVAPAVATAGATA